MNASIHVSVDLDAFSRELKEFADQIPYALSLAVNDVATQAQKDIRTHIHQNFTVRRQQWVDRSVKIKPFATKQTLTATLLIDPPGGRSDILSKFEDGGTKTSETGGKIAVPVDVQPDRTKVIPNSKRPLNLKNAFILHGKGGADMIMQYVGRGKNRIMRLAYVLKQSVPIKKKLGFVETATNTVNREWNDAWNRAWKKAIDSSF